MAPPVTRQESRAQRWRLDDPQTLAEFVRNLREGVYITAANGQILDANPAFLAMLGCASLAELHRYSASDLLVDPARRQEELMILARDGAVREYELAIRRPDGQVVTVLDTAYQVVDEETGEKYFHGILIDISDRKELERQLRESAIRDALTGCFNRRYLSERSRELEKTGGVWGAIVTDVDNFKVYNDLHGHSTGDRVLVRLARFLTRTVRAEDAVVRIGGDEFLVLLTEDAQAATEEVAERLRGRGPEDAPVSFTLGWAVRRGDETVEQTIRRADGRLIGVRARERGRDPGRSAADEPPKL